MLKLFKNAFKLSSEGILLTIPLILFFWIVTIYLSFAKQVVDTIPEALSALITLLCMTAAFCSGWFYMVKESIALSRKEFVLDEDRANAVINVIKTIPTGIGQYFLPFLGISIIFIILFAISGAIFYKIGMHYIGSIDFTSAQIKEAMASPQDMKAFLDTLTLEQVYKLGSWNLLFMAGSTFLSFMLMLWIPETIYKTQNPLLSLLKSVKKLFVKFPKSLALFAYLTFLNIVISFANTFAVLHPLIYMTLMIIYFYFLVYVVVLIFSYYEQEFSHKEEE